MYVVYRGCPMIATVGVGSIPATTFLNKQHKQKERNGQSIKRNKEDKGMV